jgi:hypothetical protein
MKKALQRQHIADPSQIETVFCTGCSAKIDVVDELSDTSDSVSLVPSFATADRSDPEDDNSSLSSSQISGSDLEDVLSVLAQIANGHRSLGRDSLPALAESEKEGHAVSEHKPDGLYDLYDLTICDLNISLLSFYDPTGDTTNLPKNLGRPNPFQTSLRTLQLSSRCRLSRC